MDHGAAERDGTLGGYSRSHASARGARGGEIMPTWDRWGIGQTRPAELTRSTTRGGKPSRAVDPSVNGRWDLGDNANAHRAARVRPVRRSCCNGESA